MTTAPAILFLDDDDELAPTALARLAEALRSEPRAVLSAGAPRQLCDGRLGARTGHPERKLVRGVLQDMLLGWNPQVGQLLFSRSALEAAGGFDEGLSLAEDHDLLLRVARLGPAVLIPDTVLHRRVHGTPRFLPDEYRASANAARERFVLSLGPESRARAERLLRGEALWQQAGEQLQAGCGLPAMGSLLGAVREAPAYASSPLFRRAFAYRLLRAVRRAAVPQPLWVRIRKLPGVPGHGGTVP